MRKLYAYGMTMRPPMPGAQPNGMIDWQEFNTKCELTSRQRVWAIIWYDRMLSECEIKDYELVRLEGEDK